MPRVQRVQIMRGAVAVRALCLSPPGGDSLFLSGWQRDSESTTPRRVGVPTGSSLGACREEGGGGHPRSPCFLGLAALLKDRVARSHF